MVIQAIALLDDLDKEINIYSMRVKVRLLFLSSSSFVRRTPDKTRYSSLARSQEWYGWHFPEMGKIITDNLAYAKVVKAMGEHIQRVWRIDNERVLICGVFVSLFFVVFFFFVV
jgi:nucleolar protein 58